MHIQKHCIKNVGGSWQGKMIAAERSEAAKHIPVIVESFC